ncbi:polysaccharide deacetylase family protein [Alkalihalobacillus hwajinpoensis]|uniref:polysaccharide deacetylase family protein n=1 Tax=Guptibacillus hwajinpoensis TaxID=208199 RepID=UPI001883EEC3|nr:polysaccharide deacetylase family protein [Pseudalkalibacillus hwajinpoensis]MBF0705438.1 polysaccharide deacetylase family protein [Pseudalkalibacillus hwajinpoensis]
MNFEFYFLRNGIKNFSLTFLFLLLLIPLPQLVRADEDDEVVSNPTVLIIYSSKQGEISENIRLLDIIVGHYTSDITVKEDSEVTKGDLIGVTHLLYYGEVKKTLPNNLSRVVEDFNGPIFGIGYNTEQFEDHFSFFTQKNELNIDGISFIGEEIKNIIEQTILNIELSTNTTTLIEGHAANRAFPLLVRNSTDFYYGVTSLDGVLPNYLSETLHEFFGISHQEVHPGIIRLEDIHPLVDPVPLKEIADLLFEKNIPYMIAVIPIYRDPETGEEFRFSDSPELLKVLKFMQNHGGTIIMHGYSHQYRYSETGEGFEFWDVKNDRPISVPPQKNSREKTRSDFSSEEDFQEYLTEIKNFETNYIQSKITKGINELVSYGLYPAAFEAPHYAISFNGYRVVSEHFSTYLGQLQISDDSWEMMRSSPTITTPSFINGLTLLPETIGYVDENEKDPIRKITQSIQKQQIVRDGVISGFYHPYLGIENFKEMIHEMETVPNLSWVDLKSFDTLTKADHVSIQFTNHEPEVKLDYVGMIKSSPEYYEPYLNRVTNGVLWVIATVAGFMIILFIAFILMLNFRKNKEGLR